MSPKTYQLKIITPKDVVYQGTVVSLIVPTERGYVGALTDHAPFTTTLSNGLVIIKSQGQEIRFQIGKGFLEILQNEARVLTESAVSV